MPGFRMLLRIAPLLVGLIAVKVWLGRGPKAAPTGRFEREVIDIVAVVDDLLLAGR
jgi:hypothetical protein